MIKKNKKQINKKKLFLQKDYLFYQEKLDLLKVLLNFKIQEYMQKFFEKKNGKIGKFFVHFHV